jgi:hypothetical protein
MEVHPQDSVDSEGFFTGVPSPSRIEKLREKLEENPSNANSTFLNCTDDEFSIMSNGLTNIIGTNRLFLKYNINVLKKKTSHTLDDKKKLASMYSELGMDYMGTKKPKTCWKFVNGGHCQHLVTNETDIGIVRGGLWHPGTSEKKYLENKKSTKGRGR